METRCEYSQLTVPAKIDYATVAGRYAAEVATLMGFGEEDSHRVRLGVSQALSELIAYSFEPDELSTIEISCERIPEGLKVAISDRGLPLDPASTQRGHCPVDQTNESNTAICIEDYMDEVWFRNLGRGGKETVLIKHLPSRSIADYYDACELEPYEEHPARMEVGAEPTECTVRPMRPSEAVEVSKSVYKAYGYSYGYEALYYPDQLVEMNRGGRILSAVAVVNGEIAGHCGLMFWDDSGRIAEMGMGVVKPEFRSRGCFARLTEFLMEQARIRGLKGVYGQAVTNHTYSQRTALSFGMQDCALKLGFIPSTVTFKRLSEQLHQRGSLLVHFKYLAPQEAPDVHAPAHHREMIARLYKKLGASPGFITRAGLPLDLDDTDAILKTITVTTLNAAFIEVERYGRNIVQELRAQVRELCLKRIDVIYLYLDLSDPPTTYLTEEFENLGFFFAGILPAAGHKGDALILQYLNNVPINYDEIKVASETARELVAYIKIHDPNASHE